MLNPTAPRKRKKGRKKKRKKENSSYALYLISKIICDRPFSFFPFFSHYIPDRSFARQRHFIATYVLPKSFRVFLPCEAFLTFQLHWINECTYKRKNGMESTLRRTYLRFIVQMVYFNSRKNVPKNVQKRVMQVLDCCFGY